MRQRLREKRPASIPERMNAIARQAIKVISKSACISFLSDHFHQDLLDAAFVDGFGRKPQSPKLYGLPRAGDDFGLGEHEAAHGKDTGERRGGEASPYQVRVFALEIFESGDTRDAPFVGGELFDVGAGGFAFGANVADDRLQY